MNTRTDYNSPEAGGSWEHRSGDCKIHGENVSFAKPYGSSERHQCVQCMLYAARILRKREQFGGISPARLVELMPEYTLEQVRKMKQDFDRAWPGIGSFTDAAAAVKRLHKCPNAPHRCPK
jgi:hypothetical protein